MITRITAIEQLPDDEIRWLGSAFFREGGLPGVFDLEFFKGQWSKLFASNMGALWVARADGRVIGGIGGIISPGLFSPNLSGVETFWYVSAAHRGGSIGIRLFDTLEVWLGLQGASTITMVFIHGLMDEKLQKFYTHRGYRLLEECWIKEL